MYNGKSPWLDLFYLNIFANGKFRSNYCYRVCKRATQKLEDIRNEETFTEIYHQACEIGKFVGVIPVIPRVVGTQKHRENYQVPNNDYASYYRQSIFYVYLDDTLASFNERFQTNSNIIISLSCILPNKIGNSSFNDLKPAI